MMKSIWALMVFAFLAGGSHVCAQSTNLFRRVGRQYRGPGNITIHHVEKVYPRGVHNLMEAPEPEKSTWIQSKRFVPGLFEEMVDWMVRQ